MDFSLQVILFFVAILTFAFVVHRIRDSQIQVEDSLFWILFAALVLVTSIFPQIFIWAAGAMGIESPANLVFLFFIFVLLIKSFSTSLRVSQMDAKMRELTQQLGIERLERYRNDGKSIR